MLKLVLFGMSYSIANLPKLAVFDLTRPGIWTSTIGANSLPTWPPRRLRSFEYRSFI